MANIHRERLSIALHQFGDSVVSFPSIVARLFENQEKSSFFAEPFIGNPVLPFGKEDEWDELDATWASIILYDNSEWRMYFSGRDKSRHLCIGLATSEDGARWTKYQNNPILENGPSDSWNNYSVYCPIVWKEKSSWKMLFTGCDSPHNRHYQVGLAESQDGIAWKECENNPVYDNDNPSTMNLNGQHETEAWGLLREGDKYYLFFNSVTSKPRQVYIAESSNLKSWKAVSASPILPSQNHPWSLDFMKYCAFPFKYESNLYLLAAMSDFNYHRSRIGLWRLEGGVFPAVNVRFVGYAIGTSSEWCKREVDTPFAVYDAASQKLSCYYGGRSAKNRWAEGVAIVNTDRLTVQNSSQN